MQMAVCPRRESGRSLFTLRCCNYHKRLVSRPWVMASFEGELRVLALTQRRSISFPVLQGHARFCPCPTESPLDPKITFNWYSIQCLLRNPTESPFHVNVNTTFNIFWLFDRYRHVFVIADSSHKNGIYCEMWNITEFANFGWTKCRSVHLN